MKNLDLQEELYQSHIEAEKISASRTLCFLGSLLYLAFGVADYYSLSVTLAEVLVIRGFIVVLMITAIGISYLKSFPRYYDITISLVYISAAIGIEAMIYLSLPSDHASKVYFAGLILVIMTVFSWAYFKIGTSIVVITFILASYAYIEVLKETPILSLFVNLFFLISATSIGYVSQVIRDRYLRENFSLQQSLKDIVEEKTIEAKDNAYLANHDPLTLLPNRRYMMQLLEESLQLAKEKDKILAILFFDLNGFKPLNDTYGHAVGDEVLIIVAKRLELAIRKGDCISRLGGDEYLVGLLIDRDYAAEVNVLAEKFTAIISEPMNIDGNIVNVGASVGIAAYPMHGNNVNVLIDIADKKMYNIKQVLHKTAEKQLIKEEQNAVVLFP